MATDHLPQGLQHPIEVFHKAIGKGDVVVDNHFGEKSTQPRQVAST
jgi:hypothetical protein